MAPSDTWVRFASVNAMTGQMVARNIEPSVHSVSETVNQMITSDDSAVVCVKDLHKTYRHRQ